MRLERPDNPTPDSRTAQKALGELTFRRRGPAASLVVILLVLVALALEMGQIS